MDYYEDPDPVCKSCTAWRRENEKLRAELARARAEGYAESLRWVDHYLAMELVVSARAALEELRRRIAFEAEHGKLTSTPMDAKVKP